VTRADAYAHLLKQATMGLGRVQAQEQRVAADRTEVERLESDVSLLTLTSAALQQLLRMVSVESLAAVEHLETYGLKTIFEDQPLSFKIETETKRGIQWMTPKLVHGDVEAPILDAFGGGPATVVAFLLRVLVCKRLGLAPVILLDEPFSMVSAEYIAAVGKFLRELCRQLGLTLIMVSHERAFVEFADKAYEATETSGGTVFKEVVVAT
jgi:DNA repair exonuclease SbcCD ATPase subunit